VHNNWEQTAIALIKEKVISNNRRHLLAKFLQNFTLLAEEAVLYLHREEGKKE